MVEILIESRPVPSPLDSPRLLRLDALLDEWTADAAAANKAYVSGQPRGPVTGLPVLDRELGGCLAAGVHVLHAGPGIGKTALALQIAASCGCPALFVSVEMSALELFRRLTARVTGTFLGRLKTGELPVVESVSLARKAAAAAPELAIMDATRGYASAEWIRTTADVLRGEGRDVLVVVDSVHSWAEAAPEDADEYSLINRAIADLRLIAKQLSCPVLAIAERNRVAMGGGGLSASAGSRKFEYGAESVWDLSTEKDAAPDATGEIAVTLLMAKNRNGSPNRRVPLRFHGALQRFRGLMG
jgi:replicative DNA helicase